MKTLRLTRGAVVDIRRILERSEAEFGADAGARYKTLLDQALQDHGEDSRRIGVRSITDVRAGYFVYHLKFSKPRVTGRSVGRPRHMIVFSLTASGTVLVATVVHEREMLERHLAD